MWVSCSFAVAQEPVPRNHPRSEWAKISFEAGEAGAFRSRPEAKSKAECAEACDDYYIFKAPGTCFCPASKDIGENCVKGGVLEDALAEGSDDDDAEDALDVSATAAVLETTKSFRLKLNSIQNCKQKEFPHWGGGICFRSEACAKKGSGGNTFRLAGESGECPVGSDLVKDLETCKQGLEIEGSGYDVHQGWPETAGLMSDPPATGIDEATCQVMNF